MEKAKKLLKKEPEVILPNSITLSGDKIFLTIDAKPNSKSNDILGKHNPHALSLNWIRY